MARRKSKKPQLDDTSILLESPTGTSKFGGKVNSYAAPALIFIIFTVGASMMGWLCVQQQHSLDELSESFTKMQTKITHLQQVMERTDSQTETVLDVEERIFALEEAQKQAWEKAEVAISTAETLKNSQFWALRDDMDSRLAETNQVSMSVRTLQAMFKNQSEEFEAVKESLAAGLSSSSALADSVARLTGVWSRADEQVASVEAQVEGQASELNELKESVHLQNSALYTNNQEMAVMKKLTKAKQAVRAQAWEEMLSAVKKTLERQFVTSQNLHSSVLAQLQTFHTKLAYAPVEVKSNEEGLTADEFVSDTARIADEMKGKPEDVEGKAERQDVEDETEEDMQEEQADDQAVQRGITEQQEEDQEDVIEQEVEITTEEDEVVTEDKEIIQEDQQDAEEEEVVTEDKEIIPEEQEDATQEEVEITPEEQQDATQEEVEITPEAAEDTEIRGQSEEQEVAEGTFEETVDGHVLNESAEKQVSEDVDDSWDPVEYE